MTEGLPDAIGRLAATRRDSAPFLLPHHIEAARRLAHAFERARLRQRVTMSYDPTRTGGRSSGSPVQGALSASAADARKQLADIAAMMPADCWAVLFDICGLDRGLQDIEQERDWPRRGGKLVLRIALSHLAAHYGLDAEARGRDAQNSGIGCRSGRRCFAQQRLLNDVGVCNVLGGGTHGNESVPQS